MSYMEMGQLLAIFAVILVTVLLSKEAFQLWDIAYRVQVQTRKVIHITRGIKESNPAHVDLQFAITAIQNSFKTYKLMNKKSLFVLQVLGLVGLIITTTDDVVPFVHGLIAALGWSVYVVSYALAKRKAIMKL